MERGTIIPNMKAKMWASRLKEEVEGERVIKSPKTCEKCDLRYENDDHVPLQMLREKRWSIVGTDVEALFPSLTDIESGRVVRNAAMSSEITFNNIDYKRALVYLRIVGGSECLEGSKIRRLTPKWRGKRPDLVRIGGEQSRKMENWRVCERELYNWEKKKLLLEFLKWQR